MGKMLLGCSPIVWRRQGALEATLRFIAATGYIGAPAGYRSGADPTETRALFDRVGLRPAPGYLSGDYQDPAARPAILDEARQHAEFAVALGCDALFVAGRCFDARFAVAGHETANRADQLSDDGYRVMASTLNEVGQICLDRGVRACFHNHAGSYIETQDEFERLLDSTDPDLLSIGLDTGHLAYGGGDVEGFVRQYAPRIRALHLKDIYPNVLAETRRHRWTYHEAQAQGLWAELGEGCVNFVSMFATLATVGFDGWAIVEVDRTTKPTPEASVETCYAYLQRIGLTTE
jgi:inosose dehydratase